jgi:ribonuclease D
MRENTYWPQLCLIQVADANEAAAIDPLAKDIDLTPLLDLMTQNEDILKVFHAGGQDIEIVCNLTGRTPHPLFDTQIAAMALGQGEQVGYSNLVDSWLGITLDKGARFTDWSRRPLDKRQIDYAIGDVTHLAEIFPMSSISCAKQDEAIGLIMRWSGLRRSKTISSTRRSPGNA